MHLPFDGQKKPGKFWRNYVSLVYRRDTVQNETSGPSNLKIQEAGWGYLASKRSFLMENSDSE